MKKILLLASAFLLAIGASNAQFSKFANNLKQKAGDALNDAVNGSGSNGSSNTSNGSGSSVLKSNGTTYYVSKTTGSNKNDGKSASTPKKNIQKVIDEAPEGATILVAEGNYFGTLDCGVIKITKPVTIKGGYSTDFSSRDVIKHTTWVRPSYESNGTTDLSTLGTMHVEIATTTATPFVIDGLFFDRGLTDAYDKDGKGKPEGVFSPMMEETVSRSGIAGEDLSITEAHSHDSYILYLKCHCPVTVQNCVFANSRLQAILGTMYDGKTIDINNNVFVSNRMAACEIQGGSASQVEQVNFSYNTVLFAWTRTRTFEDMGYGFRCMNGVNTNINHNILGCCWMASIDRCRVEGSTAKESAKKTVVEHNRFFCNKMADLMIPGGGSFQRIWANQFEDVDKISQESDNVTLTTPGELGSKIDQAYLKGWVNLEYGSSYSFNGNSGVNQFRSALGLNQQGTMSSTATMWANRYPYDQISKLFGAMSGYGAQMPK